MIHLIKECATPKQINEMLESLETYIKLAVDIQQGILSGGGEFHADCEAILIENGSLQKDIWGANWIPDTQQVEFEALINIRPKQNNLSMKIQNQDIRFKIKNIIQQLLGGRQ